MKRIIVGAIALFIGIVVIQWGGLSTLLKFAGLILIVWGIASLTQKNKKGMQTPEGFNPSFRFKNVIALDTEKNILMARDVRGRVAYIKKEDLIRWNTDLGPHISFLELHQRDMNHPNIKVRFGGAWINRRSTCEEWFSRVSMWVNHT